MHGRLVHDVRNRTIHHESHNAGRDASKRCFLQRALAVEDARAWNGPVDAFTGPAPRFFEQRWDAGVRWRRPNDLTLLPGDDEQPGADCRDAVVGRTYFFVLNCITHA